jgi:hypothetical protein
VTVKTFSLLGHTPVRALGINFEGHLRYDKPAGGILKRLFAREDETFKNALGADYQIGGALTLHEEGRKTTLRIEESNLLDDGVFYNCNFHREIPTRQAEQAVALLGDCYNQDLEDIVRILKQLLGEPIATWKA